MRRKKEDPKEQIKYLLQLQSLDSQLAAIAKSRGALPGIVEKTTNEIAQLKDKCDVSIQRIREYEQTIVRQNREKRELQERIDQYGKQQRAAEQDQEYAVATKKLELTQIDLLLKEKRIKAHQDVIAQEKQQVAAMQVTLEDLAMLLKNKQKVLQEIDAKNQEQEQKLQGNRSKIQRNLHPMLYDAYVLIAQRQEQAVADVIGQACQNCAIIVPAQRQLEIEARKKMIITCEYCGSIFAHLVPSKEDAAREGTRRRASSS